MSFGRQLPNIARSGDEENLHVVVSSLDGASANVANKDTGLESSITTRWQSIESNHGRCKVPLP